MPPKDPTSIVHFIQEDVTTVKLEPNSFDACLTDPPYFINFMDNAWDKAEDIRAAHLAWAKNVFQALKPGAPLLAFGGTRTWHHLTTALEQAGFEIRDCLMWLYGTGFPKGKQALKPAWEPIVLARKPLDGTLQHNIESHGTGALNIDSCRILRASDDKSGWSQTGSKAGENHSLAGKNYEREPKPDAPGRWAANLLLDEEAAKILDASHKPTKSVPYKENTVKGNVLSLKKRTAGGYQDSGGISRFFWCSKVSKKERGPGNDHPTLKPIKLTEYLALLLLPESEDAKLLVPFSGAGSEVIGAMRAGWTDITAIELDKKYIKIARKRIAK